MARRDEEPARREVPLVRIFLSSPGDVAEERTSARQLIDPDLPKLPHFREQVKLELIAWDDPAARIPMLATETPQESVNAARPRPADCDIVIVILWARMGTPLPDNLRKFNGEPYLSGTEWEYENAVNSAQEPRPEVLVYWRTQKPTVELGDSNLSDKLAQFQRVGAFISQLRSLKRGVNEYATPAEFRALLRQNLEERLYRRLHPSADDVEPAPTAADIPDYYDWLRRNREKIEPWGAKEGRAVTLNHVYVPALTMLGPRTIDDAQDFDAIPNVDDVGRLIPLLQRLDAESLYVSAPAGAGKSTFCRWAVLQSVAATELTHPVPAPEEFAEPPPTALRSRLPLLVPLREFWHSMNCGRGERTWHRADLEKALAEWLDAAKPGGLTGALLRAHLNAGRAFLVFDGLDEVPVSDTRDGATVYPRELLLSGLADTLPDWRKAGNRILLTSRPYGLDRAGLHRLGLPSAPLEPLPESLQDLFVTRWFHTLDRAEQTQGLIETIRADDNLAPLVESPMLLTALCVLYDSGGRLPEDRYDLYKSIISNVLYNRYPGDARERDPVERRLEAIAYGMHTGECAGAPRLTPAADISWVEVERLLARFAELNFPYEQGGVESAVRREELLTRSGLLLPQENERAAFYHPNFQEFLAAQRIARISDNLEQVFRERDAIAAWHSTLLFLFAAQIAIRDAGWGLDLLRRLIGDQGRATVKANPVPAVFIAEALELCMAKGYGIPDTLAEDFRRISLEAIEDEIDLQGRQALGLCLGRLGDPRIRDLRDPAAYVEVPAGTYPFGDEGKIVEIAAPFRLGRYPVTNAQYRAFVDDGGYRDRRGRMADGHGCGGRKSPSPGSGRTGVGTLPASRWSESAGGRRRLAAPGPTAACRGKKNGRPPPGARTLFSTPGAPTGRTASAIPPRLSSGLPRRLGFFPARVRRKWASRISPATSGSGVRTHTIRPTSTTRMRSVCCGAGRGATAIETVHAWPSETGSSRPSGLSISAFGCVFAPHQ